jgi:hypothetical protein
MAMATCQDHLLLLLLHGVFGWIPKRKLGDSEISTAEQKDEENGRRIIEMIT